MVLFKRANIDKIKFFFFFFAFTSFCEARRGNMRRPNFVKNFNLCFEVFFPAIICSHYVYKTIWTTAVCQELIAKPDERKEALDYNKFSIVAFKP